MNTGFPSLDRNFELYHAKFPEVWVLYKKFANELYDRGSRKRGSSEQIIQRIRWETDINPDLYQGFKIANAHRRRYAIMLVAEDPKFSTFFRFLSPA